jgi:hypothetical protein
VYAIKCTQLCHCSAGSDTPQDLVLQGLIPRREGLVLQGLMPRRIFFCGVSDPAGKLRPRRTRRKSFECLPFSLKGHFLKIVCIYKLHYPRHICPCLKSPLSESFFCVLRGIRPRRTTLKFEYLREFKPKFENVLGYELGAHMGWIHEKNQWPKISCYCTFKQNARSEYADIPGFEARRSFMPKNL